MTYFLDGPSEPPAIPVDQPTGGVPSFWEGIKAGASSAIIQSDSNFVVSRHTSQVSNERVSQAVERMDEDTLSRAFEERGIQTKGMSPKEVVNNPYGDWRAKALVMEMAREQASANPDAWTDLDLSEEGITSEVNGRLRAEYEEAQQILDMMPGGRAAAEFIGGAAGLTADIRNLPFLFSGAGGSFLRVMGREAFLNMGAEAVTLPSQFEMAERLDIPDPSIRTQLAMAAVGGAALGGMVEGAIRGVQYWKGRSQAPVIPGYSRRASQDAVDAVEDALGSEAPNPFRAALEAAESVRQDMSYSGTMSVRHGYSGAEPPEFVSGYSGQRNYPGSVFGDEGRIYLDADGKWTDPSSDMDFQAPRSAAYDVEFDNALVVSPETLPEIAQEIGATPRGPRPERPDGMPIEEWDPIREQWEADLKSGVEVADWAQKRGHDGIIVKGFDDKLRGASPAEQENLLGQHGFQVDVGQDQVVAFKPEAVRRAGSAPRTVTPAAQNAPTAALAPSEAQRTYFDEPGSDTAAEYREMTAADIADEIELNGDIEVDIDGKGPRKMSSVMKELDDDDEFLEALKLCGMRTENVA